MSDFMQFGPISTLHLLAEQDASVIEREIEVAAQTRPIALVLPCLISEMDGPALKGIMSVLESAEYLREIIVTLGPTTRDEFARACEYFAPLQRAGRAVRLIWNDGAGLQALYREIEDAELSPGPHGKGRSAWMAYGYVVSRDDCYVIALHDCDILQTSKCACGGSSGVVLTTSSFFPLFLLSEVWP